MGEKVNSKRCHFHGCRKRLSLVDMPCLCKHVFCLLHRLPEQHCCSGDYKGLKPKVEGCIRDKVIKI